MVLQWCPARSSHAQLRPQFPDGSPHLHGNSKRHPNSARPADSPSGPKARVGWAERPLGAARARPDGVAGRIGESEPDILAPRFTAVGPTGV